MLSLFDVVSHALVRNLVACYPFGADILVIANTRNLMGKRHWMTKLILIETILHTNLPILVKVGSPKVPPTGS